MNYPHFKKFGIFANDILGLIPRENKFFDGNQFSVQKPRYRIYHHKIEIFNGRDVKNIAQCDGTFISLVPWMKEL